MRTARLSRRSRCQSATLQFDFDGTRGDYIFTDVPAGAKWFFFTTFIVVDQNAECIAVDSSSVEAIEPDWVEHKAASEEGVECEGDSLIGNYPITMDASKPSPLRFLNRFKPTRHGYINNGRMGSMMQTAIQQPFLPAPSTTR